MAESWRLQLREPRAASRHARENGEDDRAAIQLPDGVLLFCREDAAPREDQDDDGADRRSQVGGDILHTDFCQIAVAEAATAAMRW